MEGVRADPESLKHMVATYALALALFLPGALVGGVVGWIIIRPVNWLLGRFFRGFNVVFDAPPASTAEPSPGACGSAPSSSSFTSACSV